MIHCLYFFWWAALAFWTHRSFLIRSTEMSIFSASSVNFGAVNVASCSYRWIPAFLRTFS